MGTCYRGKEEKREREKIKIHGIGNGGRGKFPRRGAEGGRGEWADTASGSTSASDLHGRVALELYV